MKHKLGFVLVAVAIIAVLGYVILSKPAPTTKSPATVLKGSETSFTKEITIRNVTDQTLRYKIYPAHKPDALQEKEIAPNAIDRYPTDEYLEIEFNNGEEDLIYSLDPGSPYSFRYDQGTTIDLFLGSHGRADAADLAPWVPTPMVVVEEMLRLANVTEKDVVYDIGCGDGRIVITAGKKYGARGVGIDIDPSMIEESRSRAKEEGVEHLVSFLCMDALKADFSEATVVTLYLLPESNELLRPKFEAELQEGVRFVSHNYTIPGWEEKETAAVTLEDENGTDHNIYVYIR